MDIVNIRLARKDIANSVQPKEPSIGVEKEVIGSPLAVKLCKEETTGLLGLECKLAKQIILLGAFLQDSNDHIDLGLLESQQWLHDCPSSYSMGSTSEMQILLHHSYAAWWQTEGALELLRSARAIAAKDSEDEMEDERSGSAFKRGEGSHRTKEELLEDVSINRIWGYLCWAVEDVGSLAAKRPSYVKMAQNFGCLHERDSKHAETWTAV